MLFIINFFQMQQQIQAKQKYLREHILDQNYDAEDFAEFCSNKYGNIDINSWTFQDLENIVKQYKQSKKATDKNSHQLSFANCQQQQIHQKNKQIQRIQPKVLHIDFDEIKEMFKHPNVEKPKQQSIEQLFKDPFSKKMSPNKQNPWINQSKLTPNQFDFMNIIGKPIQQPKKQSKINDLQFQNIFNSFQLPPPIQNNPIQTNKPNLNIFELNFEDQKTKLHKDDKKIVSKPEQNLFVKTLSHFPVKQIKSEKSQKSQKIEKSEKQKSVIQKPIQKQQQKIVQKKNKIKYEGPKIIKQDFYDIIQCNKAISRSLLNNVNLEVQITGHEIVNRNFFVPDYVLYHVFTKGINIEVKRKYNHFLRLRNMLAKYYPGYRLPYLQKNSWLSQTDIEFIKKQKVMIQYFMNDVLMNKEFKNCRIVEQFLTFKETKNLKAKLQQYQKMAQLTKLQQLCLLNGEINIAFSDQHRIYAEKLNVYLQNMETNIQKYKKLCQQLTSNYGTLLKTYTDINEVMTTIQTNTKTFNSQVQIGEFYDLEKAFHRINQIYKQMGNNIKFDLKILENEINPYLRFEKQNLNTIRQLCDIKNNITNTFVRITEIPKNENYKNNKKLDAYKINVYQPSKNYTVLKYQTAYYNNQCTQQNMRMFDDLATKMNKKFIGIATMYEQKYNQVVSFWKNIKIQGLI